MKKIILGNTGMEVPAVVIGCMRLHTLSEKELDAYLNNAVEQGANFFDHADIYGQGKSETLFGNVLKNSSALKRENLIIQSKCGIRPGYYDQSKEHIIQSVDEILKRLQTDYLDILLIHRPDALIEPWEMAEAFDQLESSGKVKHFGVSNHKPMQMELLKKYIKQDLIANQLQLSLPVSNMIANGIEVNMTGKGAVDYDGSVLDYCRLKDITIQAWSPFQKENWQGTFFDCPEFEKLNKTLTEMAEKYGATKTMIASAWITRHPANMQIIAGSTKIPRINEIIAASDITLSRQDWYKLYLDAGHILP